ncbi:MAG: protein of unknown function transrane [Herbinix sp.]|jgi:drug/metabolite transporter (DMT)-like permease|nr:protein of unknown function transrane [Herbinix sp.]
MKKQVLTYKAYAMITIIIWVLAYIFTKIGLKYYSALSLSVFRYLAASIYLIIVIWIKKVPFPKKRDIPGIFLTGSFGFAIYVVTFNIGAESVSVATSSIIISTTPLITAVIANFCYRERLSKIQWIAVVIEFTGVTLICIWDSSLSLNTGVLWILVAAVSFSLYNILQRKLTKSYTPFQTTSYCILSSTLLLLVFLPQSLPDLKHSTPEAIISVLAMGIFCSGVAYTLWSKALALAPKTSDVTNYIFLSPFLSALLGAVILGEIPNIGTLIGGLIVMVGMFLFEKRQKN